MTPGNDRNAIEWRQWHDACTQQGISLSAKQVARFEQFYDYLSLINQSLNLTRITALDEFLYRSLLDSLVLSPFIPANARLADVGSGGGFPAIPLAIARPDVQITAIESIGKKAQFIRDAAEKMDLSNLTVLAERSELLGRKPKAREQFDIVTARAVAALPMLVELCLPLLKVKGQFLAMKGLSYQAELDASANALKQLGGRFKEVHQFEHPKLEGSRLVLIDKVQRTPAAYPRHSGAISKKPL